MSASTAIFVIAVVAIGCATSLISDYLKTRRKEAEQREPEPGDMEMQLEALEERIRVLERIITESKYDLRREINDL